MGNRQLCEETLKASQCVVLESTKGTITHDVRLVFTASLSEFTPQRRPYVKKRATATRLVS
jgi:hypothetical protein